MQKAPNFTKIINNMKNGFKPWKRKNAELIKFNSECYHRHNVTNEKGCWELDQDLILQKAEKLEKNGKTNCLMKKRRNNQDRYERQY